MIKAIKLPDESYTGPDDDMRDAINKEGRIKAELIRRGSYISRNIKAYIVKV